MNEQRIQEIKDRLTATCRLPWTLNDGAHVVVNSEGHSIADASRLWAEEFQLIANAPADIAFLLSEVDRLRGEAVTQVKEALTDAADWIEATQAQTGVASRALSPGKQFAVDYLRDTAGDVLVRPLRVKAEGPSSD